MKQSKADHIPLFSPSGTKKKQDMTIILFSSLTRLLRLDRIAIRRRGYSHVDTGTGTAGAQHRGGLIGAIGGRGGRAARDVDAENRLIDQLDEEWDED